MVKYGCNICNATFANSDSHDCKQNRIERLETTVVELIRFIQIELLDSHKLDDMIDELEPTKAKGEKE